MAGDEKSILMSKQRMHVLCLRSRRAPEPLLLRALSQRR